MQTQDIERDVRKFIADQFFYGRESEISADASLLGSVIDSTGLLELVTFVQEHFGITVEDEDIVPENLGTVQQVVNYVDGKLKAKSANG
jgi:acyl carrier protein